MSRRKGLPSIFYAIVIIAILVGITPVSSFAMDYSPGMISYWKLDDGSGTTALDSFGTNNGALVGPTWTAGQVNGALNFTGSDYVEVPHSPSLNPQHLTLEAWVHPTSVGYYRGIVEKQLPGFASPWVLYALNLSGNTSRPNFNITINNIGYGVATDQAIPLSAWTHLAGTYDGETLSLYVNGALVNTNTAPSGPIDDVVDSLYIGKPPSNAYYYGKLDEVAVYDRALSAAEIEQHYQNGVGGLGYEVQGNTPAGSEVTSVTVDLGGIDLTFADVTASGNTTSIVSGTPQGRPPSGFRFHGNQFDISTDASYTPPILVTFDYDENLVPGNEAKLKMFHWDGSRWEDVTVSVDTVNNTITGQVNSLSPFILGSPTPATGINSVALLALALAGIAVGTFAVSARSRLYRPLGASGR